MSPRFIRNEPGRKENLAAALASAVLAAGVGVVTFYFVRLFLARDSAVERPVTESEGAGSAGE